MVTKSANTLVASAFVFLFAVLLIKFGGAFFENNVAQAVASISGAESVPLFEFKTPDIDWEKWNPTSWDTEEIREGINRWVHDIVDKVLPAAMYAANAALLSLYITARLKVGWMIVQPL